MNAQSNTMKELHDNSPDMADSFEKLIAHLDTLPKRDARRILDNLLAIALWMIFTDEHKFRPRGMSWTRYLYSLVVGCCSLSYYRLTKRIKPAPTMPLDDSRTIEGGF